MLIVPTKKLYYPDVRHLIKSGDLIAFTHDVWGSWYDLQVMAVRIGGMTKYTHVAPAVWLGDNLFVIESVVPLIRAMPLSNMSDKGFYWCPLPEMGTQEFNFLMSKIGRGTYSKWEGILAQLGRLKVGSDDLWECAELTIAARALSGVNLGNVATPAAVVDVAMNSGPLYFVNGGSE